MTRFILSALLVLLFATPALSLETVWGRSSDSLLADIAACSANFTQPDLCPSATFVDSQTALEDCFDNTGDPVCVLTRTIFIDASDRDSNGATDHEGLLLTKADGDEDPKLVCAPGVQIQVNSDTTDSLELVHVKHGTVGAGDENSFPGIHGCTIVEYLDNKPGGNTRGVEGIVYKLGGSLLDYHQDFECSDNTLLMYSTGSSSIGCGVNPSAKVPVTARRNLFSGVPIGFDTKTRCEGCEEEWSILEENIVFCNDSVANPRGFKHDNDNNLIFRNNTTHGCVFSFDAPDSANQVSGTVIFSGNSVADISGSTTSVMEFNNGTPTYNLIGRDNTFANIELNGAASSQFLISTGGLTADFEGAFLDCPGFQANGNGEWFDIRAVAGSEVLGDLRFVFDIPDDCTLPTTAKLVPTTAGIDAANTRAFFQVGDRTAILDGAQTAVQTNQDVAAVNYTDDYGRTLFVAASPSTDFDTGFEVAGHAKLSCLDVYTASTGALLTDSDADGRTCDETISAASIVLVQGNFRP